MNRKLLKYLSIGWNICYVHPEFLGLRSPLNVYRAMRKLLSALTVLLWGWSRVQLGDGTCGVKCTSGVLNNKEKIPCT
jgi:hypothetical protein